MMTQSDVKSLLALINRQIKEHSKAKVDKMRRMGWSKKVLNKHNRARTKGERIKEEVLCHCTP